MSSSAFYFRLYRIYRTVVGRQDLEMCFAFFFPFAHLAACPTCQLGRVLPSRRVQSVLKPLYILSRSSSLMRRTEKRDLAFAIAVRMPKDLNHITF